MKHRGEKHRNRRRPSWRFPGMPRNIRWMLSHQWQPPSASIQAATQHLRLPEGGGCYRLSHHFALLPDQAAPASLPTPPHISFRSKPRQRLPASLGQTHLPPRTPATTHDSTHQFGRRTASSMQSPSDTAPQALRHLARYVHKGALSEPRL